MNCECGNCHFDIKSYNNINTNNTFYKNKYKAGVIVSDPSNNSLLLVQSRGNLWGFPKGSMERGELPIDAALRELEEETGIKLPKEKLINKHKVYTYSIYYEAHLKQQLVRVQETEGNDVNAIIWVKLDCLNNLLNNNLLKLNSHARYLCKKLFNMKIKKNDL